VPGRTIIYLHPHFTLSGGAGKFVLETAKRLAERGHRIIVVTLRAEAELVGEYTPWIEFINLGGPLSSSLWFWLRLPLTVFKVVQILDKYPKAIIFPQVFPANWWGFIYKWWRPQRQVVWMCQEPSAFIHSSAWINALPTSVVKVLLITTLPILKQIDTFLAQHCDYVFCNSDFTLTQARNIYDYSPTKLETLYLGADLEMFRNTHLPRQKKIVTVSRLSKFKHVEVILEALSFLNQNRAQPITLTVIGDGEEKAHLERLAKTLKLKKWVTFMGHVPDTKKVVTELNSARAFVLASIGEPFGLAPVEAMACGTPAVVSNSGGMTETVIDGKTGFHFKGGNSYHLSQILGRLVDDDQLFTRLSTAAIKRGHFFTWQKTTDLLEKKFTL
jgi:glycosyltransferase involved in cell wall biosynthesis